MKKKTWIIAILSVLCIVIFVGVFYLRSLMPWYREEVSAETFEKAAEEAGFVTEDILKQYGPLGEGMYDAVIEAADPDGKGLVTFYDVNIGGTTYNAVENLYNMHYGEMMEQGVEEDFNTDQGSSYQWAELITDERYLFLSAVENTLLYADVDIEDRQVTEELINTLNYR